MKILMLARALPAHRKGGVPDHAWMLARALASRGIGVHLLTTRLEGGPPVVSEGGVTVRYLPGTRPDSYEGGWWSQSAASVRALHDTERYDLLHCQSSSGYSVVNTGLHRRLRLPALVSQHGTDYDELVTRWRSGFSASPVVSAKNTVALGIVLARFLRRDRPYLRRADGVIATSEEQYRLIARVYGIPPARLHKVYNGMDLAAFTPGPPAPDVRARHGIAPGAALVLCVARLIRDKGVQNAIAAMPAVAGRVPGCRLLVVGDGPYRGELERLAAAKRAPVVFAGEMDLARLPDYFRSCDLFVNATNQQNGYDLTMVEAMACARPVVSTDIGSTPTLIADGIDGALVPLRDLRALAGAVSGLLLDPARRRELGARAREKVTGRFGLEAMVDGTIGAYEALASRRGAPAGSSL